MLERFNPTRIWRSVKRRARRGWLRLFYDNSIIEMRDAFENHSAVGLESGNVWVRRSARVRGFLMPGEPEFIFEQALASPPGNFLEIGSLFGKSTSLICGAATERGRGEKVIAIDPFTGAGSAEERAIHKGIHGQECYFQDFIKCACELGYYEQVIPVGAYSTTALPALGADIAFAFIDGSHERAAVEKDFELVQALVRVGGKVLFHDALVGDYPGVLQAIKTCLDRYPNYRKSGECASIVALERVR